MTDNKRLNTRAQREAELDAELEELEREPETEAEEEKLPDPKNLEEESWASRYANLRSYSAKKEKELSDRIASLEKQMNEAPEEGLPKRADPTAIREWMNEFPDVASIVLGIVEERQEKRDSTFKQKLEALEMDRKQLAMDKAINKVNEAHKDFPKLKADPNFQKWISEHADKAEQGNRFSAAIVEALWGDSYDADAAIEAIARYKLEKNTPKRTQKDEEADAAASVRGSSSREPATGGNKPTFKESQIEKMSHREYDKYEEAIELARLEGRIIYDLSGAAR